MFLAENLFGIRLYLAFFLEGVKTSMHIWLGKTKFFRYQSYRGFVPFSDNLLSFFLYLFRSHNKQFKPLEHKFSVMEDQNNNVKAQEKEIVDELEHEVEDLEKEFSEVEDDDVSESVREKQKQVENILSEVHEQLDFLREISDEMPGDETEDDQKE